MSGQPVPPVRVPAAAPQRMPGDERAAVMAAVAEVTATGPYVGGPAVEAFERDLAGFVGSAYAVGVGNGSDALTLALHALALPAGGEVLVPANDGGFAAAAAQAAGLQPVVVDVDARTGLATAQTLEDARTPRSVAAVVTHLHGLVVDLGPVTAWCEEHGVALVEDCAQAHGARLDGRHVGTVGDVATFSFYPTKNLGALGDAGAVVTDRTDVAERARSLRQYGWEPRFRVADGHGRNSRLDPLQAAVLSARLPFLDERNEARREVLRRYREAAPSLELLAVDEKVDVVHHAVARTVRRDDLRRRLEESGVVVDVHYPYLVQEMPGIRLPVPVQTPSADALRRECLSLPCFPTMTDDEIEHVAEVLAGWCADER